MTKLLVSVRSANEAEAALDGGADLIDVKEPHHGALGRTSVKVLREIAVAVAGRTPLSAALGELGEPMDASVSTRSAPTTLPRSGWPAPAPTPSGENTGRPRRATSRRCCAVGVCYADATHAARRRPRRSWHRPVNWTAARYYWTRSTRRAADCSTAGQSRRSRARCFDTRIGHGECAGRVAGRARDSHGGIAKARFHRRAIRGMRRRSNRLCQSLARGGDFSRAWRDPSGVGSTSSPERIV